MANKYGIAYNNLVPRRWTSFNAEVTNEEFASLPERDRHDLFTAMKAYRLEVPSGYTVDGYGSGLYRIKPSNGTQGRCLFFTRRDEGGTTVLVALLAYKKESRRTPVSVLARARERMRER